jgi:hypothetical protein
VWQARRELVHFPRLLLLLLLRLLLLLQGGVPALRAAR